MQRIDAMPTESDDKMELYETNTIIINKMARLKNINNKNLRTGSLYK